MVCFCGDVFHCEDNDSYVEQEGDSLTGLKRCFATWVKRLPHPIKLCVAGNADGRFGQAVTLHCRRAGASTPRTSPRACGRSSLRSVPTYFTFKTSRLSSN